MIIAGPYGGYGNTVAIDHGDGLITIYAHQESDRVVNGEWVVQGEVIGTVGCTGLCTGPHLHFETRVWGAATDPLELVGWLNKTADGRRHPRRSRTVGR